MMQDPFTALIAFLAPSYLLALGCVCVWAIRNPPTYHTTERQIVERPRSLTSSLFIETEGQ